jgi:predicted phage-related endonuclease
MSYKVIPHAQGTQGWLDARKASDGTASELSAAAGKSKYQSRTELLAAKSTGLTVEVNTATQALYNKGHSAEATARVIAELIIEDEFYPTTATLDIDGLTLLASFDGINLTDDIIFEHKLYNKDLVVDVREGTLSEHYTLQMDQQLLVSGADKCLFMCSDGTQEKMAWCWYTTTPEKLANVVKVWKQFNADLQGYVPAVIVEAPKAEAIIDLPAVIVQVKGELTLCNIADMRPIFDKFLSEATVNLVTDNDFAQAEAESKIGRDAAKRCIATAKGVIDQTATISEVTRELEQYAAKFNALALSQEKAVKTQKEARKLAIMTAAKAAFTAHLAGIELEIKPIRLIIGQPNFPEAMKSKRLLSAIQDAVDSELARVKIEADSIAKLIRLNLCLVNGSNQYKFLFSDIEQIIYKPFDDLKLLIESRIAAHEKAESEKLEALRIKIEAEAKRKAEAEQSAKLEAERAKVRAEEQAKVAEENRLAKVIADAKAKADKEDYDFEMAAQHAENEKQQSKARVLANIEAVRVEKEAQEAQDDREVKVNIPKFSITGPSRAMIIEAVANFFASTNHHAETWLVAEFGAKAEVRKPVPSAAPYNAGDYKNRMSH